MSNRYWHPPNLPRHAPQADADREGGLHSGPSPARREIAEYVRSLRRPYPRHGGNDMSRIQAPGCRRADHVEQERVHRHADARRFVNGNPVGVCGANALEDNAQRAHIAGDRRPEIRAAGVRAKGMGPNFPVLPVAVLTSPLIYLPTNSCLNLVYHALGGLEIASYPRQRRNLSCLQRSTYPARRHRLYSTLNDRNDKGFSAHQQRHPCSCLRIPAARK